MRCGERLTGEGDGKIKCNAEGGMGKGGTKGERMVRVGDDDYGKEKKSFYDKIS